MTLGKALWQLELGNANPESLDVLEAARAIRKNSKMCQNFAADVGRQSKKVRKWKGDKYELC